MFPGSVPANLNSCLAMGEMGGRLLDPGATAVTFYLADLQFEHLGSRGFTHNPLIMKYVPPADRNVIATQTAALFVDELLRRVKHEHKDHHMAIEVKGDVADTPARSEIARLEKIIKRHEIPVEGYTRGNHSSGNVFGVVNLSSPSYDRLRALPIVGRFSLDEQLLDAAGDEGNVLTQRATIQGMHRILHSHRKDMPGPEKINTAVDEADGRGVKLLGTENVISFKPEHQDLLFHAFWRASRATRDHSTQETRFWECLVNYDIADQKEKYRTTKVNPFYLQASETCRLKSNDGCEYPVYTISLDGLDHTNLVAAVGGGVSELQVRLIENFMNQMLKENPRARFKISSHFSAKDLTKPPWYMFWRRRKGAEGREAFRKLLSREEIILYSYGHTHERKIVDLNQTLKLGRSTPLTEINVPSLIDYHPNAVRHDHDYHDARALVVEKLHLDDRRAGDRRIVVDLEYRGLDREDIVEGNTADVQKALKTFSRKHGYIRARETNKMLQSRYFMSWVKLHFKRLGVFATVGLNPFRWTRFKHYWRDFSLTQYVIDNFTVVSTINMFNEAYHLLAFLESVIQFIKEDDDPGELAVRGQLESLRMAILEDRTVRLHQFEKAIAAGERAHELAKFNDLFRRTKAHRLSDLLMQLRAGGQARAFAILAGIEASKGEFEFHKKKPTKVPNTVPTISIPVGSCPHGHKHRPSNPPPDEEDGELMAAFSPLSEAG